MQNNKIRSYKDYAKAYGEAIDRKKEKEIVSKLEEIKETLEVRRKAFISNGLDSGEDKAISQAHPLKKTNDSDTLHDLLLGYIGRFYKFIGFIECQSNLLNLLDLSHFDFAGFNIERCNLSYSQARIDPQKVGRKSLFKANLEGLDLRYVDFKDVEIAETNLKNTGAYIDPQIVYHKNLSKTNLEGLNLRYVEFTGVKIAGTNLKNTGARIDLSKVASHDENTILEGCVVTNGYDEEFGQGTTANGRKKIIIKRR